jgi:hypothetical protein
LLPIVLIMSGSDSVDIVLDARLSRISGGNALLDLGYTGTGYSHVPVRTTSPSTAAKRRQQTQTTRPTCRSGIGLLEGQRRMMEVNCLEEEVEDLPLFTSRKVGNKKIKLVQPPSLLHYRHLRRRMVMRAAAVTIVCNRHIKECRQLLELSYHLVIILP